MTDGERVMVMEVMVVTVMCAGDSDKAMVKVIW